MDTDSKKIIIECDCGSHLLQIISDIDTHTIHIDTEEEMVVPYQHYYLAMYNYGEGKPSLWDRIKFAFRYLRKGENFTDQLVLTTEEAKKAADFINENLLKN